jgi:hypothetical protein
VDLALERYIERPELADLRKIKETTDIWELRLLREKLRVYFFRPGPNLISICLVGKKDDQDFHVPKLQVIRDREEGRYRAAHN